MRSSGFLFGIIGTIAIALGATNVKNLQTSTSIINQSEEGKQIMVESIEIPKKEDLLGTYTVDRDKNTNITLKDDGTYALKINVCERYLLLTGTYELRDSKLILKNNSYSYKDLENNEELSFTIVDENTLKSDESLVCTTQETLFEK